MPLEDLERHLGNNSAMAAQLKKLRADAKAGLTGQTAKEVALAQVSTGAESKCALGQQQPVSTSNYHSIKRRSYENRQWN